VPNTWPDSFGADWEAKRDAGWRGRSEIHILGNISAVTATGNTFGLRYLAREVLPRLDSDFADVDWTVNVTGGGSLADDLRAAFDRPRVVVKGFVPDLDAEMLSNDIFLLLNNAGPYTGGYTRVVYAMSSGACVIAHRRLADSMPEVRHGDNALLGETAAEIVAHVMHAARDSELRRRIGRNARRTYEREFHPCVVMEHLVALASLANAA
jgi:glycosyltransferase involved in cell wall biosynthesis